MAKLSNYPRIGGTRKLKPKKAKCHKCRCGELATHATTVQFWHMRGDDEDYYTCETHKNDVEFLTGGAKWEKVNG